jgi:RNA polymerase sigma-70 factor (ECF subfamily)
MTTKVDNSYDASCRPRGYEGDEVQAIAGAPRQMTAAERDPRLSMASETENRIALTRIFEQHRRGLLLAALRITRNRDEAEDVVQEAAIRALLKLHTFRGESRLETWIYAIVGNCAISRLRRLARHRLLSLDSEWNTDQNSPRWVALEAAMDPEGECLADELHEIVCSEMETLKAPYRTVIQLCDFEGWSCPEAAGVLKLNKDTLKGRLYRGRRILRKRVLTRVFASKHRKPQVIPLPWLPDRESPKLTFANKQGPVRTR